MVKVSFIIKMVDYMMEDGKKIKCMEMVMNPLNSFLGTLYYATGQPAY